MRIETILLAWIWLFSGLMFPKTTIAQCTGSWATHIKTIPNGGLGNDQPEIIGLSDGSSVCVAALVIADSINIGNETFDVPDPTPSAPAIIVIRLSPEGEYVWHATISAGGPTSLTDATVDDIGNVYLAGTQRNGLLIQGNSIPGVSSDSRYFILKLDSSGLLEWYHSAEFGASTCSALSWRDSELGFSIAYSDSVQVDSQTFQITNQTLTSSFDMVVGKLDENGNLLSQTVLAGSGSVTVNEMSVMQSGIILQGRFEEELIVDGQQLMTLGVGHYSFYQLMLNNSLSLEWINVSVNSSSLFSSLNGMSYDSDFVYSSGFYDGEFSFGGTSFQTSESRAMVLFRTGIQNGVVSLIESFDDNSFDISETVTNSFGAAIIGGYYGSSTLDINGELLTNAEPGLSDSFIARYDADGNLSCSIQVSGLGDQSVRSIQRLADGHILTLINFNESITLDDMVYTPNGNDILVWKTCLPCDTGVGIEEADVGLSDLTIYPNPATAQTQLNYHTPQGGQPTLLLTDMLGRVVKTVQLPSNEGTYTLDASGLGAGVYFCTLLNGIEVLATQKLVVAARE